MTDFKKAQANLEARGYTVRTFATAAEPPKPTVLPSMAPSR